MPGGDRTGPAGTGPRTGRGAGYCGGSDMPGYANSPGRFGPVRGFRGGDRGWRRRFHATGPARWAGGVSGSALVAAEDEATALKDRADRLRSQLDATEARLGHIKKA